MNARRTPRVSQRHVCTAATFAKPWVRMCHATIDQATYSIVGSATYTTTPTTTYATTTCALAPRPYSESPTPTRHLPATPSPDVYTVHLRQSASPAPQHDPEKDRQTSSVCGSTSVKSAFHWRGFCRNFWRSFWRSFWCSYTQES